MFIRSARLSGAVLMMGFVVAATTAQAQDAPAGDAARGKQLYLADGCYECHGYVGQGSVSAGPRVAPLQLPLDAFKQQLRSPSNEMPPYVEAALPDAGVADIYAFLRSIPAPAQAAKDVPILNR